MDNNKLDYFKLKLLQMKQELEVETKILDDFQNKSMKDSTGELSTFDNHPADMASETERREVEGTLLRLDNEFLFHINEALEAIKNGKYGICKLCGRKISLERLEAIPETLYCIEHGDK